MHKVQHTLPGLKRLTSEEAKLQADRKIGFGFGRDEKECLTDAKQHYSNMNRADGYYVNNHPESDSPNLVPLAQIYHFMHIDFFGENH